MCFNKMINLLIYVARDFTVLIIGVGNKMQLSVIIIKTNICLSFSCNKPSPEYVASSKTLWLKSC